MLATPHDIIKAVRRDQKNSLAQPQQHPTIKLDSTRATAIGIAAAPDKRL